MIAVLPSVYVCYGTVVRVFIIHNEKWDSTIIKEYFDHAILSWVACIITDGIYTVKLLTIIIRHIRCQTMKGALLKVLGLLVSLTVMLKLGCDVYYNFHHLTSDKYVYLCFFGAVIAKTGKILTQGTIISLLLLTLPCDVHRHSSLEQWRLLEGPA